MDKKGFLSELYGKDLVIYGTGNAGKTIIPFLVRDPNIKIHGVTNSRTTVEYAGTFLETGLPVRSIYKWAKLMPDAVILITAFRGVNEIFNTCKAAGFHEIMVAPWELACASVTVAEDIAEMQLLGNLNVMCLANEIHDTHVASFSEFKACHKGEIIAVVGTGPTLNYYTQIKNIRHIGVNSSFLKEDLKLDYYFLLHYIPEWCDRLKDFQFHKFFRTHRGRNPMDVFPEFIIEENHPRRFFQASVSNAIQTNIEYYPLMGFLSVIFPAIQFALYTRPKKLLLVGCDCTSIGHYDGMPQDKVMGSVNYSIILEGYRRLKEFVSWHYPDTEIVSVNPVGLKGLFRDIYTEKYLEAHPEVDKSVYEIMNSEGVNR